MTSGKKDSKKAAVPAPLRLRMQTEPGEWLGFRMAVIANFYSYEPRNIIAEKHGLIGDELSVLANLHDWGGMTANVICALTGRPKNSVSRAVIRLTNDGLIEAQIDAQDRRRTILTITEGGRALYQEALAPFVAQENKMFGVLSAEEREQLSKIMFKILRGWSEEFVDE
ncbi:MAG TPA: MarR family winged helix-turn-helix transcriptional regulator [Novosphingobium sp.]|nr:MarR family winged helix-turn-helix transcriptional regulator [Novosphingobium sp.]